MSGVLYDANGNVVISQNAPVDPQQMVYDSLGNVINPAREDGHLADIGTVISGSLDAALSTRSSETTLATINGKFVQTTGGIKVDGSAVVQPVSATALPLPAGAATEATLSALNAKVTAVNTGNITVGASALPVGAATDTSLTNGNLKAKISDAAGNALTSTGNALDVNLKTAITVNTATTPANSGVVSYGSDGTYNHALATDGAGQVKSVVTSSALPTGAATDATLSSINSKIPASPATEGGNLATISSNTSKLDVLLSTRAADTTLSALSAKVTTSAAGIKVDGSSATQPISATALPLPSGAATDATLTAGTLKARTLDGNGNAISSTGTALDVNIKSGSTVDVAVDQASDSILAYGFDGAVNQKIRTNPSGQIQTAVVSSALPTGAATDANLNSGAQKTQVVDAAGHVVTVNTDTPGSEAMNVYIRNWQRVDNFLSNTTDSVQVYGSSSNPMSTDASGNVNVNVLATPLPTNAATESTLAALNLKVPASPATEGGNLATIAAKTTSIATNTSDVATQTTLSALNTKFTTTANGLKVDNSAVTQPVSAAALPLPAGAATSLKQTDGTAKTQIVDGLGNVIGSTSNAVDVNIKSAAIQIQTAVSQTDDSIVVFGNDGGTNRALLTDNTGKLQVAVASSQLPTGAATETTLSSLNGKVPADPAREGGNLASVKSNTDTLVATAATLALDSTVSALNTKIVSTGPGLGIKVDGSAVTQPVSATALPLPAGASTLAAQISGNNYLQSISNSVSTEATLSSINDHIVNAGAGVIVAPGANTFPVSVGSLPLPSGAAKDLTLTNGTQITKILDGAGNSLTSTSGALDVNIKGDAIRVDVNLDNTHDNLLVYGFDGVNNQKIATNTLGVLSANILASALPTGAATDATLASLSAKVTACNTGAVTVSASALPTGAATDATLTSINGKITAVNTGAVTVSSSVLPTGAATSAAQTTAQSSFTSIDGKIPAKGQANMASSTPVAIASDQTAVPISAASLPLPTGAATAANQTTGNASLSSIDTKFPAKGQANMASSTPVVVASDQTLLTKITDGTNVAGVDAVNHQLVSGKSAVGAAPSTNPVSISGVDGGGFKRIPLADTLGRLQTSAFPMDGYKQTYRAAATTFSLPNTPTDGFTIYGSATKTIKVLKVMMSGTQGATSVVTAELIKRSTANTGGTSTVVPSVPNDSANTSATATVRYYTANPTSLGTAVGTVAGFRGIIPQGGTSSVLTSNCEIYRANTPAQALTLRGATEGLALNFNSITLTGNVMSIEVEWTEE